MSNKPQSVSEIAALLADDPSIKNDIDTMINQSKPIFSLLKYRIQKSLTQSDIAKRLGWDQSKVSRIESGDGSNLKFQDWIDYLSALNINTSIIMSDEDSPATDRIKEYVFRIDDDLKSLSQIVKQDMIDSKIQAGIDRFFKEVLFNFLRVYSQRESELPSKIEINPSLSKEPRPKTHVKN